MSRGLSGKAFLHFAAIAVFSASAALMAGRLFPLVAAAENRAADIRLAMLSPPEPQHPGIVIAAVTEDTLAGLPYRSPLDRRFLAGLLETLDRAGVRAVGLDVLFDQPTEAGKDEELRRILKSFRSPLVAAWADQGDSLSDAQAAFLGAYLEGIEVGRVSLMTDSVDGVVRWFDAGPAERRTARSLVSALAGALGAGAPSGPVRIAYRTAADPETPPFKMFPAHTLGFLPRQWLAGKIVLIGSDLPQGDRFRTPMSVATGGNDTVPGVVVHAHALAQILEGRPAPGLGLGGETFLAVLLALLGLLAAALDIPTPAKVAAGIGGMAGLWIGGFALFKFGGLMIPLLGPSIAFVLAGGVSIAYMGRHDRRQKKFIRQAFSRYVSPSVVDSIADDPSSLSLGGERRELTYIFTDIAGFTSLVEKSEPAVVLPLLNQYLDAMCRIALEHQGTIDKIVGDAVVVFFGAPADQPDHAARAVSCGLAMHAFANGFAEKQRAAGIPFGVTRVGINTGPAIVGNFGGDMFFDYTAHGDTVNTAARMESVNKHLGTTFCVTGATKAGCPDMHFRPVGSLVLKGKTEGVAAFEPLTADAAASPDAAAYVEAYRLMEREDSAAAAAFAKLAGEHPEDGLAAFHARRLAAGETGTTIVMKEK